MRATRNGVTVLALLPGCKIYPLVPFCLRRCCQPFLAFSFLQFALCHPPPHSVPSHPYTPCHNEYFSVALALALASIFPCSSSGEARALHILFNFHSSLPSPGLLWALLPVCTPPAVDLRVLVPSCPVFPMSLSSADELATLFSGNIEASTQAVSETFQPFRKVRE